MSILRLFHPARKPLFVRIREPLKRLIFISKTPLLKPLYLLCVLVPFMRMTTLYVNQTASLPVKYILSLNGVMPRRGDLVNFTHPRYPKGILTKRVVGVAGDRIHYKEGTLYVNAQKVGPQFPTQSDGRPLTPIVVGIIPEGHYFVMTPHERSLDSRYQEIGLIKASQIKGKGIVLW